MPLTSAGRPEDGRGLDWIAARQRSGGGWGYGSEAWTEPTALALLALSTEHQAHADSVRSGVNWLKHARRPDGGWPPNPVVDQSVTWATSLALLALTTATGESAGESVRWLLSTSGAETSFYLRLIRAISSNKDREGFVGWPWYPGTAAWVAPTGMAILALERVWQAQTPQIRRSIGERVQQGRDFLLARRCLDGGSNHGSSRALGYEAESYPETTGIALLGLNKIAPEKLKFSLSRAATELANCPSAQGRAWLRLALLSHNQPAGFGADIPLSQDVADVSLAMIARAAGEGKNVLLG